jgi:putative aminopeptidase FrvX
VQLVHNGVAAIDLGFPCRYTHSAREVCDLTDLERLCRLVVSAILRIEPGFSLDRDDYPS